MSSLSSSLEEIIATCDDVLRSQGGGSAIRNELAGLNVAQIDDLLLSTIHTTDLRDDLTAYRLDESLICDLITIYEDAAQCYGDRIEVTHYSTCQQRAMDRYVARRLAEVCRREFVRFQSQLHKRMLHMVEDAINTSLSVADKACNDSLKKDIDDHSKADTVEEEEEIEKEVQRMLGGGKRPGRKLFPGRTICILNALFERETHPTIQVKLRLSQVIDLTPRQITTWFQNNRSRDADRSRNKDAARSEERDDNVLSIVIKTESNEKASRRPSSDSSSSRSPSPINANLLPAPLSTSQTPTFFFSSSFEPWPADEDFIDVLPPYTASPFRPPHTGDSFLLEEMTEAEIWNTFTIDAGSSFAPANVHTEQPSTLQHSADDDRDITLPHAPDINLFALDWPSAFQ